MTTSAWQPVPLSGRHRPSVYPTPVSYFAERVRRQQFFAFARAGRSFWDAWLRLPKGTAASLNPHGELLHDLIAQLSLASEADPNRFVATSHLPYPEADRHRAEERGDAAVLTAIEETLPRGFVAQDAQLWMRGTIDGSIRALYEALRPWNVVAVGPEWLIEVGGRLKLPRFGLTPVSAKTDVAEREALAARIEREHASFHGAPVAYLFHAGLLSPWLTLELHGRLRNAFLIDLGSALDVCDPARAQKAPWGRLHWNHIAQHLGFEELTARHGRTLVRPRTITARTAPAPARTKRPAAKPAVDRRGPVAFVEKKAVDFGFVEGALGASKERNHWTNFGPASERLEEELGRMLGLPSSRRAVVCASGTAALFGLAALAQYRAGRPLRWVTSAFGFHPARQGPFSEARLVDCDARAMLDLRALERLPEDAWDAVLVTNTFGALEDPAPYQRLCRERGKVLLLDSALGLDAHYRKQRHPADEIVSFHHTKPWGMGEGGCAIVDAADADVLRSIFNFGTYRGHATGALSFNGKISDFACAFIQQRLRDFEALSPRYHLQHARIATIARRLGYEVLGGIDRRRQATPAHVPLLAPHPVGEKPLENRCVTLRKYYEPLERGHATADDLYARIVNVPCHPGLEALSEGALRDCLAALLSESRPGRRSSSSR